MTEKEKIELLADVFDAEPMELTPEKDLDAVEGYDSMSKLSLIVMMDEEFGKKLTGEQLREFKTVGDILAFME